MRRKKKTRNQKSRKNGRKFFFAAAGESLTPLAAGTLTPMLYGSEAALAPSTARRLHLHPFAYPWRKNREETRRALRREQLSSQPPPPRRDPPPPPRPDDAPGAPRRLPPTDPSSCRRCLCRTPSVDSVATATATPLRPLKGEPDCEVYGKRAMSTCSGSCGYSMRSHLPARAWSAHKVVCKSSPIYKENQEVAALKKKLAEQEVKRRCGAP